MTFTIYPAIDIRGGKCVRLMQGDYGKETVYGDSPVDMVHQFTQQGTDWVHIVDLDGAKAGTQVNHELIIQMAQAESDVRVQVGGGIRSEEAVAFYLEHGVDRVILGSSAVSQPEFVKKMLANYPEKIAIGIDAKDGYVAVEGWLQTSTMTAIELGKMLVQHGARHFIFTDIARDGMLQGPNIPAIKKFAQETGGNVIASGGVTSLTDLDELLALESKGVRGAIIGKAIYTGKIKLSDALSKVGV